MAEKEGRKGRRWMHLSQRRPAKRMNHGCFSLSARSGQLCARKRPQWPVGHGSHRGVSHRMQTIHAVVRRSLGLVMARKKAPPAGNQRRHTQESSQLNCSSRFAGAQKDAAGSEQHPSGALGRGPMQLKHSLRSAGVKKDAASHEPAAPYARVCQFNSNLRFAGVIRDAAE